MIYLGYEGKGQTRRPHSIEDSHFFFSGVKMYAPLLGKCGDPFEKERHNSCVEVLSGRQRTVVHLQFGNHPHQYRVCG